jgi:hypothetical protein
MENKESNFSPQSLSELPVGIEFPPTILQLSESHISKYLEAIDDSIDFLSLGLVPPSHLQHLLALFMFHRTSNFLKLWPSEIL